MIEKWSVNRDPVKKNPAPSRSTNIKLAGRRHERRRPHTRFRRSWSKSRVSGSRPVPLRKFNHSGVLYFCTNLTTSRTDAGTSLTTPKISRMRTGSLTLCCTISIYPPRSSTSSHLTRTDTRLTPKGLLKQWADRSEQRTCSVIRVTVFEWLTGVMYWRRATFAAR